MISALAVIVEEVIARWQTVLEISIDAGKRFGQPCIRPLRITVSDVSG